MVVRAEASEGTTSGHTRPLTFIQNAQGGRPRQRCDWCHEKRKPCDVQYGPNFTVLHACTQCQLLGQACVRTSEGSNDPFFLNLTVGNIGKVVNPVRRRCATCAKRRVFCDMLLPTCSQCAKRGEGCTCHYFEYPQGYDIQKIKDDIRKTYVGETAEGPRQRSQETSKTPAGTAVRGRGEG